MCGRFSLSTDVKKVRNFFGLSESAFSQWKPRYNIAPSEQIPVILEENDSFIGQYFKWGLIPHWAKDPKIGFKMINARAETLNQKPSFKSYFKSQRCLIPCSGFYEWKKVGAKKFPYFIHLKNESIFAFAGLWSKWKDPKGKKVFSCTIITGPPNERVARLHHRMPVILPKSKFDQWLDSKNEKTGELKKLFIPYPDEEIEIYPVSTIVNSPRNDVPECMKRVNTIKSDS